MPGEGATGEMNLSSPNRIVWQYFEALRRLVHRLCQEEDKTVLRQDAALAIILAVAVVEVFLNIFFRVVVSEPGFTQHESRLLKDLDGRKSLEHKIGKWPRQILGKGLDFTAPAPKAFMDLKNRRNALMHFTSSHETVRLAGYVVLGLADTTVLDSLTADDAGKAFEVAEGMVCEILRLRGVPEDQIGGQFQAWTGQNAVVG